MAIVRHLEFSKFGVYVTHVTCITMLFCLNYPCKISLKSDNWLLSKLIPKTIFNVAAVRHHEF